ncbi:MAG: 1,4-alpha-glucan branching protein GlgB [Candidatus Bipolaricaulia bacterium]
MTGQGNKHEEIKSQITKKDVVRFNGGDHCRAYNFLGAHIDKGTGKVHFAVWAPNADSVSVVGDFNSWKEGRDVLSPQGDSGIWSGAVSGASPGDRYKYHIESREGDYEVDKADPYGFYHEEPPKTASIVWDLNYDWDDSEWLATRGSRNGLDDPISIYEVHLGSWKRVPEEGNRSLTYREIAPRLGKYVEKHGFTHVEFLPLMEHPFYGSWGYQATGYFAPTSRYGEPEDLMYLIDHLHQRGIGVILDWVPSHFTTDEHGLGYFDGTHLYEHADPRKGRHPDWDSYIFNYGRNEVRSFLLSSANFWLDRYHVDGLRVDAVASMLYLDYSRDEGEWVPNKYGGNENLEAISFIRDLNETVYENHPDVQTIAEESTAWPMVSSPTYIGGLGFGMKWDMGWMHDTLQYLSRDPVYRSHHHNELTFRMVYAFNENFVLPLSHDEVVHGKGSLLNKLPGDDRQKLAGLRLLYGYMFAQPGKNLLFMGGEFGQWREWSHERSLDWHLVEEPPHEKLKNWVGDLNQIYRTEPALHELDFDSDGFEWVEANDSDRSVLTFLRKAKDEEEIVLAVFNFTPEARTNYRLGVPRSGRWKEILNSDAETYGGEGYGNFGGVKTSPVPAQGRQYSVNLTLPPLGALLFKWEPR